MRRGRGSQSCRLEVGGLRLEAQDTKVRLALRCAARHKSSRQSEEGADADQDLLEYVPRKPASLFRAAHAPVEALEVVSQNHSADGQTPGQGDFEGISLHLAGNRANDGQARFVVVRPGRKNDGRAAPGLFAASLGIEVEPDEFRCVGNVAASYHSSFPTGGPQSLSAWRLRGVMPRTSWARVGLVFTVRMRIAPGPMAFSSIPSPS